MVDSNDAFNGALYNGNIYISKDNLANGKWAGTLVHEYTHYAEGSKEYNDLVTFLVSDTALAEKAADKILEKGYGFDPEKLRETGRAISSGNVDISSLALDGEGEVQYNSKYRKTKRTNAYSQYYTEAMSWANNGTTRQGEEKVLYDPKKNTYNLIVADAREDMGFRVERSIRDTAANAEAIHDLYEGVYNENYGNEQGTGASVREDFERYWNLSNNRGDDNLYAEEQRTDGRVGDLYSKDPQSDGIGAVKEGTGDQRKVKPSLKEGGSSNTTIEDIATYGEYVSEMGAHMTEEMLGSEAFIDRLVRTDAPQAERIMDKLRDMIDVLKRIGDAKAMAEYKRLRKAEKLYLDAIEAAGKKYVNGKIVSLDDDEEKENTAEGGVVRNRRNGVVRFSQMNLLDLKTNVDMVLEMSDEDALKNREEGNYISIMRHTPAIVTEHVKDAEDLEIVMRFDSFYLATRKEGVLEGHYHNYGEVMKDLPKILSNPLAIVRMDNGRLNCLAIVPHPKGNNNIVSIDLNTVKDINSKHDKYNLIVTVTPAKDNYIRNNLSKHGVEVEYQKEDLSQVNDQLYEWLASVNEKSSSNILSQNPEKSTLNAKFSLTNVGDTDKRPTSYTKEEARAMVDSILALTAAEGSHGELKGAYSDVINRAHALLNSAEAGKRWQKCIKKRGSKEPRFSYILTSRRVFLSTSLMVKSPSS